MDRDEDRSMTRPYAEAEVLDSVRVRYIILRERSGERLWGFETERSFLCTVRMAITFQYSP